MQGSDYRRKLMSAEQAAALIPDGARLAMGLGVAAPPALLRALADRAEAGAVSDLRLYYMLATSIAGETVLRHPLRDRIRAMSLFHGVCERALDQTGLAHALPDVDLVPAAFSQVPALLSEVVGVDTLLTTVAPMDEQGNFSLGTNTDYALACSRSAQRVILEVNAHMPRVRGDCTVPLSRVTAIVENDRPLLSLPPARIREADAAIGATIAGLAEDGDCLQMGIGALPDAVCAALRGHRGLGVHTEMLGPGLAALMQAGVVDNSRKAIHRGRTVFTFAMGDAAFYDFLDDNPALEGHPVDYVNDAAVIARNPRMLSVNATLQVDLAGACNSEGLGGRQYSGAGGQLDFVRGASRSEGGRSIIACHSTAANGTVSRIVPRLNGPVTTPRNDTQIVVTEHGWANLRGLSLSERATALIGLAHPDFRAPLEKAAWEAARQG